MTAATAVLWGLGLVSAGAATLGAQQVRSAPGQPLRAAVLLNDVSPAEADGLTVKLADAAAFRQVGIRRLPALDKLSVWLTRSEAGTYIVHFDSSEPVSVPYLDVLLVLEWRTGRQSAVYTLAATPLQPSPAPQAVVPAAVAPSSNTGEPAPVGAASSGEAAAKKIVDGGAHVVRHGDTLSSIAQQYADEAGGASVAQLMTALFEANRNAFIGNDPNRLRQGATLNRPADPQVQAVAPAQARKFVASAREQFDAYRARLAESTAGQAAPAEGGRSAQGAIEAGKAPEAAAPATRDELKLSRPKSGPGRNAAGANAGSGEEERIARDKADAEAQGRVNDLQKNVADLQKLLAMKNQAVADLEKQNATASGVTAGNNTQANNTTQGAAKTPAAVADQQPVPAAAPATASAAETTAVATAASAASEATSASQAEAASMATATVASGTDAAASAPVAATASAAAAQTAQSADGPGMTWRAVRENPYALPGAGLLAALLGIYWLMRRRHNTPPAVGQDGPYDSGDDGQSHWLGGGDDARQAEAGDDHAGVALGAVGVAAGAAALYEANQAAHADAPASEITPEPAFEPVADAVLAPQTYEVETDPVTPAADAGVAGMVGDLDLTLPGQPAHVGTVPATPTPFLSAGGLGSIQFTMAPEVHHDGGEPELDGEPSDADFDTPAKPTFADAAHEAPSLKPLSFDLSDFSLDLKGDAKRGNTPAFSLDFGAPPATAFAAQAATPLQSPADVYPEVAAVDGSDTEGGDIHTKLELAAAYQSIGDDEGARELLEEVMRSGNAAAQSLARTRLAALGK
ncbi:peptidoglycan-binding LysM [Pandoraea terrae]|uniref:Peptidoglycan-binding LysM n=1 Tax=Pandoraea terrae TaxID=1537710 RepID=A0A5E4VVA8_9BURK|nr:FimV/HubP family polar landmark protein [Pandoraea terrae]VVE16071.1 peptidoglycan-binding LysM [Pandoraea terrae]